MKNISEAARLDALQQLNLLDTSPSEAFDRITRMAGRIFNLPIAAISLTDQDRQWFKSRIGVEHTSIPRNRAPCAQVTKSSAFVLIPDLLADSYYCDSPLAQNGVRFYAGAPLTTPDGFTLGAMCVLGVVPRSTTTDVEVASLHDLAAMVMSQIELQHAFGRVDSISGLPNRTQFIDDLDDLGRDSLDAGQRLAVLIDLISSEQLDNAVRVMGSAYLDEIIGEAAQAIRSIIGPTAKAYHVAATQFALLAPPGAEAESYVGLLAKMLNAARGATQLQSMNTLTIGVAPFVLNAFSPRDVLRMAHNAQQDARQSDSKVSVYSSVQDTAHHRRFSLLGAFGAALEASDQLSLVYQPRIDVASGACIGAEALLRWNHPVLGAISPGEFIPIVEQTSMARPTTAWVLEAALRQLAVWRKGGVDMHLSVNISSANLLERDFADRLVRALGRYAVPAGCLELEVTESAVMADERQALVVLEAIAATGVKLAIDDFGTGYSSLSYLQRLPVHVVKIDQSFTHGLVGDDRKQSLVSAMISLSHDLGYRVVIEGVETQPVLDFIRTAGCDEAQGYFFAKPMPAEVFVAWLRDWARVVVA